MTPELTRWVVRPPRDSVAIASLWFGIRYFRATECTFADMV